MKISDKAYNIIAILILAIPLTCICMAIPYIAYLVFSPLGMGTEAVVFTLYLGLGAFLCSKLE